MHDRTCYDMSIFHIIFSYLDVGNERLRVEYLLLLLDDLLFFLYSQRLLPLCFDL